MDKRFYLNISRGAAASLLWLASQAAFAASAVEEAQTLLSQGQFDQALKKVDAQLKTAPQDAEARFLRGLILVKLNRGPEAIKVFADLTRDYPQLPEPYNNLAVLYAQQGDYEKARDALEAALKARDIGTARLHTSHGFHSSMMDPVLAPFAAEVAAQVAAAKGA